MKKAKQRRPGLARIAASPFNTQGLCKLVFGQDPADKTSGASRPLNKLLQLVIGRVSTWSRQAIGRLLNWRVNCVAVGIVREGSASKPLTESTRNLRRPAPQKCLTACVPFLFPPSTHRTQYPSLSLFLLHPFRWFYLTSEIEDHTLISLFSSVYL